MLDELIDFLAALPWYFTLTFIGAYFCIVMGDALDIKHTHMFEFGWTCFLKSAVFCSFLTLPLSLFLGVASRRLR